MKGTAFVWFLAIVCFVFGFAQQYVFGIPTLVADAAGVDLASISQLVTWYALFGAVGSPLLIAATARRGQRFQLLVSLAIIAAGMILMGLTSVWALLLVSRAVMGFGSGVFLAVSFAIANTLAPSGKETAVMANITLGFSSASVLSMPVARFLYDALDWHIPILAAGIVLVAALVVILRVKVDMGDSEQPASFKEQLRPLASRKVLCALLAIALMFLSYSALSTYITPFLDGVIGVENGGAVALLLFVLGLISVLGSKGAGIIADRAGKFRTAFVILLVQSASLVLAGVLYGNIVPMVAMLALWMLTAWGFAPVQNAVLAQIAGPAKGMAIGLANSFQQLGSALGALVAGGVVALSTYPVLAIVAGIACALALVVQLFVGVREPARES